MATPEDALEVFPRPVMDDGKYSIFQYGPYLVDAPKANRFAALTYMARDLRAAVEMLKLCATGPASSIDNTTVRQALWIATIVLYAKGFKKSNNARKGLAAEIEIATLLEPELKTQHDCVMRLRDKYAAHDDGVGEDKEIQMSFPLRPARVAPEIGIVAGNRRVVSLGTDRANELIPLFEKMK